MLWLYSEGCILRLVHVPVGGQAPWSRKHIRRLDITLVQCRFHRQTSGPHLDTLTASYRQRSRSAAMAGGLQLCWGCSWGLIYVLVDVTP